MSECEKKRKKKQRRKKNKEKNAAYCTCRPVLCPELGRRSKAGGHAVTCATQVAMHSVVCEELACCCAPSTTCSTSNHEMSQHTCTVYVHVRMAEFLKFFYLKPAPKSRAPDTEHRKKKTVWPNSVPSTQSVCAI